MTKGSKLGQHKETRRVRDKERHAVVPLAASVHPTLVPKLRLGTPRSKLRFASSLRHPARRLVRKEGDEAELR
jgi:hypothetical protein